MTEVPMQDCHRRLQICLQRIADVESINKDLESRLETHAHEFITLESEAADSLARWKIEYAAIVSEAASWRQQHAQQERKTLKIREQLLRTERELHGILQKKYDIMELARREERNRILASGGVAQKHHRSSLDCTSPAQVYSYHNLAQAHPQDIRCCCAVIDLAEFFRFGLRT